MDNKPVSIMIKELEENIKIQIQDSGIHPTIVELILKDLLSDCHIESERQYQFEIHKYNELLNNKVEQESNEDVTE